MNRHAFKVTGLITVGKDIFPDWLYNLHVKDGECSLNTVGDETKIRFAKFDLYRRELSLKNVQTRFIDDVYEARVIVRSEFDGGSIEIWLETL